MLARATFRRFGIAMKLAHAALSGLRSNIAARSPQNESAANVPTMFQFIQSIAMPPNDFLFARPPRAGGESIAEYGFPQVYVKYTFARKTALKYTFAYTSRKICIFRASFGLELWYTLRRLQDAERKRQTST